MTDINCVRCKQVHAQLVAPPLPNDLGARIYDSICRECWGQWLQHQTAMINHYGLDLREPSARQFLTEQTEQYLFGQPKVQSQG